MFNDDDDNDDDDDDDDDDGSDVDVLFCQVSYTTGLYVPRRMGHLERCKCFKAKKLMSYLDLSALLVSFMDTWAYSKRQYDTICTNL